MASTTAGSSMSHRHEPAFQDDPRAKKQKKVEVTTDAHESSHRAKGKAKAVNGPPVKNACLTCRSKKAKCDGTMPICNNCVKRGSPCEYVKSKRGGARKPKPKTDDIMSEPLAVFLKRLESMMNFQEMQTGSTLAPSLLGSMLESQNQQDTKPTPPEKTVRTFAGGESILGAYYSDIYPFLPILPLPGSVPFGSILATLGPKIPYVSSMSPSSSSSTSANPQSDPRHIAPNCSPLLLSFLTILVLAPHPSDPTPSSFGSRLLRRKASERYAAESLKLIDSAIDYAGVEGEDVSMEIVQALVVLSKWEMAQNGNLQKTRQRLGHAVQVAMDLGLHRSDANIRFAAEWLRDMRRRTWWLAFSSMCQSGLVSGTLPSIGPYDPRITCEYPVCTLGPNIWDNQMNVLKQITRAGELIMSVDYPEVGPPDLVVNHGPVDKKKAASKEDALEEMVAMDRRVLAMLRNAEKLAMVEVRKDMGPEAEMARNFQVSALFGLATTELALHRQGAFPEVAFFSKRMCGLPSTGKSAPPSHTAGRPQLSVHQGITQPELSASSSESSPNSSSQSSLSSIPPVAKLARLPTSKAFESHTGWSDLPGGWSSAVGPEAADRMAQGGNTFHAQAQDFILALGNPPQINSSKTEYRMQTEQPRFEAPPSNGYQSSSSNILPSTYHPIMPTPAPSMVMSFPPHSNTIPPTFQPQSSFSMDYVLDDPFSIPIDDGSTPQPWWNTQNGAGSLVLAMTDDPFSASLMPDHSYGGGFPYTDPNWMSMTQTTGYPAPVTELLPYNPYQIEQERQRLFAESRQQAPPLTSSAFYHSNQPSLKSHSSVDPAPHYRQISSTSTVSSTPASSSSDRHDRQTSITSSGTSTSNGHADSAPVPWGVNAQDLKPISQLEQETLKPGSEKEATTLESFAVQGPFAAGLSLARCSAAAHTIVRLEILHRSAAFALLDGPPRALPFCACGLVAAAHAFLLLALAIQAGDGFGADRDRNIDGSDGPVDESKKKQELESLYLNVRIILAGLEKYGQMWEGLASMAEEVRIALTAAQALTTDVKVSRQNQIEMEDYLDADGEGEEECASGTEESKEFLPQGWSGGY